MAGSSTSNHGNHDDITYRLIIDIAKIQANVYACEGGRLSELAVRNWLKSVGFKPESKGDTWLGTDESIRRLDRSEILRRERVQPPREVGSSKSSRRSAHTPN